MRPIRLLVPRVAALAALLALVALTLSSSLAYAQAWSGAGAPVCTASGQQYMMQVASDGAGGAFVGWSDQRPGTSTSDIFLTRIGPDGAPSPGWPVDGIVVCAATGAQLLYSLAPDGAGGVFLVWEDYRSGGFSDVYGHHVLASGLLAPGWPLDGLGISVSPDEQRDPKALSDGTGGLFCVWADARTYSLSQRDIYAQHLNGDGSLASGWAANGMCATNASTYDYRPRAAAEAGGGLYVTWSRGLAGGDIGAQHLGATGAPFPTWSDTGIVLCGAFQDQHSASVVTTPGGTAMAVWTDLRNYTGSGSEENFFAARFGPDTSRAAGWPHEGAKLYASTNPLSDPFVVSDGAGGMLFMWGELVADGNQDLFVMHVDSLGTLLVSAAFPDGIVPVCLDPSFQDPVSLAPDGAGGAFAGWTDYRADPTFANPDPYVQHVTAGATIATGWPATGVALTSETTPEGGTLPVAVAGGVIAVWSRGSGFGADLFASFVGLDGVVPALVSLVSSEASPDRVRVTWEVTAAAVAEWRIERRDEASSWLELTRVLPDGQGRVSVTDPSVVAGRRYGYRLAPAAGGAALGETWIDVPRSAATLALLGVWPNPLTAGARVRYALPEAGEATLVLLDLQGRPLREWSARGGAGEREQTLTGLHPLAPGVYWLRLRQGAHVASTRIAIVR